MIVIKQNVRRVNRNIWFVVTQRFPGSQDKGVALRSYFLLYVFVCVCERSYIQPVYLSKVGHVAVGLGWFYPDQTAQVCFLSAAICVLCHPTDTSHYSVVIKLDSTCYNPPASPVEYLSNFWYALRNPSSNGNARETGINP